MLRGCESVGEIPDSVAWERHVESISMLFGHGVEDVDHIFVN